jgi:sec-independent protein translocase protein TatC
MKIVSAEDDVEQPFVSHLLELRDRLLRIIIGILLVFIVLLPFANDIYQAIAAPLKAELPESSDLQAFGVVSPFFVPIKTALILSIFIAVPWILYQFWAFVAPGLYRHEKRLAVPLVISSTLLFYLGMLFAYFVVLPLFSKFMAGTVPAGVDWRPDINLYLSFLLTLFFAFGIAFEVPVATILLCLTGATTPDDLARKRPYIFVGAFVIGMLLTPPDVISQTLLALPMWILFEIGVVLSRIMIRRKKATASAGDAQG